MLFLCSQLLISKKNLKNLENVFINILTFDILTARPVVSPYQQLQQEAYACTYQQEGPVILF